MRILHIGIERSWRGGENQIRLLVKGLKDLGVSCYIAYPEESRGYEVFPKYAPTTPLASTSPLDPRSLRRLVKLCRDEKIDLIDAHSAKAHALALRVKKRLPHIKLVVHRRVDNPIKTSFFTRRKYLSPLVDRYVAISSCIEKMLIDYGVPTTKISVVKSAIDPAPYQEIDRPKVRKEWREKLGLPPETTLIGNASAITHQKGYDVLIRAVGKLRDIPNLHCAIAGDGDLKEDMEQLTRQVGVRDRVHFLGHIQGVPSFLSALDVLCVPSNNEGLGTLILEGILAGCPVIATRVGGIPEMILHEKTGLLVEKGDHEGLAEGIRRLVTDREFAQQLNAQARERVMQEFSLESMVTGNLTVYKSL